MRHNFKCHKREYLITSENNIIGTVRFFFSSWLANNRRTGMCQYWDSIAIDPLDLTVTRNRGLQPLKKKQVPGPGTLSGGAESTRDL